MNYFNFYFFVISFGIKKSFSFQAIGEGPIGIHPPYYIITKFLKNTNYLHLIPIFYFLFQKKVV